MRISGVTLPENKRIEIALTSIYGVGRARSHYILDKAGIEYGARPNKLTPAEENSIRKIIEGMRIEGELKREISGNIKRLKDIGSYRGSRHARSLPVRGQRTKTNQRTRKGNVRKTMGSGRVKVEKK